VKVLLSTTPGRTSEKWPPLGLLYIAASLRELRNDLVTVLDAFCLDMDRRELLERVEREAPDVIGMSCSTHTFLESMTALEEIKERLPETVIMLGGYHATFTSTLIMKEFDFIDYVVKGEGERTVPALLDHIERGVDPAQLDGISYRRGDERIENPFQLIEDLDSGTRNTVIRIRGSLSHLASSPPSAPLKVVPTNARTAFTLCFLRGDGENAALKMSSTSWKSYGDRATEPACSWMITSHRTDRGCWRSAG